MKRRRKNYKPEEKVITLKRHLPVVKMCQILSVSQSRFYRWHNAPHFKQQIAPQQKRLHPHGYSLLLEISTGLAFTR
jgi:hypothetical protein